MYLFPLATAVSTVNGWAVCRVTNPLQDCRFSRICSSYDEDSELDLWNRAGLLFGIHWLVSTDVWLIWYTLIRPEYIVGSSHVILTK